MSGLEELDNIIPGGSFDAFADADNQSKGVGNQAHYIHVRTQQRCVRKELKKGRRNATRERDGEVVVVSLSLSLSLSESISRLCVGIRACITQRKTTKEEDVGDVEYYMITLTETVRFFFYRGVIYNE